jgi:energy-coupling factor transport system substrate-specific component
MRSVKDVVVIAFLSAVLTAGKLALSGIPNIEIVSFLIILYTARLGWAKTLLITVVFATTEVMIWGFGIWTFGYYLFWPLLV